MVTMRSYFYSINSMTNINKYIRIALITTPLFFACNLFSQIKLDVKKQIKDAEAQYLAMLRNHLDVTKLPQSIQPDGKVKDMPSSWWCSGFFGGSLWYLYQYTGDVKWKTAADKWTMAIGKEKNNTSTHDLGFMLYCSFGNGYRLTKNKAYRQVLLTGAKSLASRFNPDYGVIKSWDEWKGYNYPVIIDNMMNLEFLLWAGKASGDISYNKICVSHADITMKNHFRNDYSSYHVVCYGPGGKVLAQKTHQGYSDSSAWSRGQGWGLYGYTVMYRETKNSKYLQQAEHIARFILDHPNLPKDKIPYWDFNAPGIPNEERDASAAAVVASGLLELSRYSKAHGKEYFNVASTILSNLSKPEYKAAIGTNGNFILKHSVGSKPYNSEVDVPLVYADYYYLEALLRYDALTRLKKQR
jgi:unsaturated chondroitin disaccharide hydrolase